MDESHFFILLRLRRVKIIKTELINKYRHHSNGYGKMQDSILWEEAYFPETKQSQKQSGKLLLISFFSFLFD